ncbi:Transcriptional regulator, AraC family [Granulibacter bethesdensis]|uniref:Transcriptional regulator, AraC family n=1 Tax=Granulibacter bethesdensis TaxID=364410 RepID=A0AAC9P7G3_9PROT|nr:GlxA family transcriptional regulator [Granulibacter bethesdensis]APH53298.1 Transcriptional regulator, AraC family [Granulibacter bethesdensis]APH60873.1 Transcriptional regulator, AraC family [Granulibacter bethesdensis]
MIDTPARLPAEIGRIGFLTLPNYSMIAMSSAIEACRMANRVTSSDAYSWQVLTLDGEPAQASNGLSLGPTVRLADAAPIDLLLICGGVDIRRTTSRRLFPALQRHIRRGGALGALCTGSFVLAEAGMLSGYACAIHWEDLAAIREEFPDIVFRDELFVIDRDRFTSTGGTAPLDMMLALIAARLGPRAADAVARQFLIKPRQGGERQHLPRTAARHPRLAHAVALLEANAQNPSDDPLSIADAASLAGLSSRQLERLFKQHLNMTPAAYAASVRLERAQLLLRQTAMPITEIGVACGFSSGASFSNAYRLRYGHSPRHERVSIP